ncbi:hypothetical protein Bhyg_11954 [Pseudolycoriella hygida]|uniref:MYND-type domain-containing protein n=1 Tax=Pseudolycoriella hygida TaxID=35572 RepID=A0A9Q0S004_9DIPT|nr:hypothetical protein Bhyg_11954 [Pseudolycoriella hygida]
MMYCLLCYAETQFHCNRCDGPYCSRICQTNDWPQHRFKCSRQQILVGNHQPKNQNEDVVLILSELSNPSTYSETSVTLDSLELSKSSDTSGTLKASDTSGTLKASDTSGTSKPSDPLRSSTHMLVDSDAKHEKPTSFCINSTATLALESLLPIPPLDLHVKSVAFNASINMKCNGKWLNSSESTSVIQAIECPLVNSELVRYCKSSVKRHSATLVPKIELLCCGYPGTKKSHPKPIAGREANLITAFNDLFGVRETLPKKPFNANTTTDPIFDEIVPVHTMCKTCFTEIQIG